MVIDKEELGLGDDGYYFFQPKNLDFKLWVDVNLLPIDRELNQFPVSVQKQVIGAEKFRVIFELLKHLFFYLQQSKIVLFHQLFIEFILQRSYQLGSIFVVPAQSPGRHVPFVNVPQILNLLVDDFGEADFVGSFLRCINEDHVGSQVNHLFVVNEKLAQKILVPKIVV